MKGKFITIEGIEGVGKSTVAKLISTFLTNQNKNVIVTREPGGTILSEKIRELLLHSEEEELFPETELLLFFAARKQHCMNLIIPSINAGSWVVCDRFKDASYAYQGGGRNISIEWIDKLVDFTDLPDPDLTILLDASKDTIDKRLMKRTYKDRIEKEEEQFFSRVRDVYLQLAKNNPQKYKIINANLSLEEVKQEIKNILIEYL